MSLQKIYEEFHYNIAPPLFVVLFTSMTQVLATLGSTRPDVSWSLMGNVFSWKIIFFMFMWSLCSLWIPSKVYHGPKTDFGYTPVYKANGFQYFIFTVSLYILLLYCNPSFADDVTKNFPQVLATCNICALLFCIFLVYKGKHFPEVKEDREPMPAMYEFYSGVELHPRLFGVDVKQLTNSRFGLMTWGLLVITFFVSGWINHGFQFAFFVCAFLQVIYLGKFYWWETGYFNTLDITLDRAGYYICWGCLVWVPCFYTFSSYYLASRPLYIGKNGGWLIFFVGIFSTILNYWVDWEKCYFRERNGICRIWLRTARYITATYKTSDGLTKKSQLLISGFWGRSRHMNYLFEILVAFSWSLPSIGLGLWPFLYPVFLTILLVHRCFRDEKKCQEKYGKAWEEYCELVPYRFIPYVF